jgi:hypothetical protein
MTCGWVWYQNPGPGNVACGSTQPSNPNPFSMGYNWDGQYLCRQGRGGAYMGTNPDANSPSSPDYMGIQCTAANNGRAVGTMTGIPRINGGGRAANWRCTCTG